MNGAVQCVMSVGKYLLVDCLLKECKQNLISLHKDCIA